MKSSPPYRAALFALKKEGRIFMTRTQAREIAFFIVFEHSFSGETVEEIINKSTEARDLNVPEYSSFIANKVIETKDELDAHVSRLSKGWTLQIPVHILLCRQSQ